MSVSFATVRRPLSLVALAAVCLVLGLVITAGGARLAALGGSTYYVLLGLALLATSVLLWRRRAAAAWVYALATLATVIWALVESGLDGWALLPRIVPMAVLGLWFALPGVARALAERTGTGAGRRARLRRWLGPALCAVALAAFAAGYLHERFVPATAHRVAAGGPIERAANWPAFGSTIAGDRFTPAAQVTPQNVAQLELAWSYRTGDAARPTDVPWAGHTFQSTPINVGDSLYLCTPHNVVIALDAETGHERWRYDPDVNTHGVPHLACRGVAYVQGAGSGEACDERLLMGTVDDRLVAIDRATGRPCDDFGADGFVDLTEGLGLNPPGYHYVTSPPTVVAGVAVVGSFILDNQSNDQAPGVVRAYDVRTGELRWAWDVISPTGRPAPAPGESFPRNTPNAWTVFSADPELGLVYVPTGNTPPDFYGALRRPEQNRYSSSIVALDVQTGDVRWSFQTVYVDVWDFDVGSQPVLTDFRTDTGRVPALIAPTKRGEIFVLDRRTGVPVAEVIDRPVPQDPPEGERLSPTQPYSIGMPSFAPRDLTEARMWGATPIDQLWCRIRFRSHRYEGQFTPLSTRGSIVYPSSFGSIDWGSVAVDPERRLMIVNSTALPYVDTLIPRARAQAENVLEYDPSQQEPPALLQGRFAQAGTPFAVETLPMLSPLGIPCHQPPWGELSAVDLETRKTVWRRPLGTTRDHAPLGIPFPMGVFNLGGSVTTRGGVVFIGATIDQYLRGFDVETGRELWRARLPAGGQSNPMSYVAPSGRQFVVIAAGGHTSMQTRKGDYVLAYALPGAASSAAP
jgi:quinoprotein glucose dehydrogenase/quinate dehydrogenase (quinone)